MNILYNSEEDRLRAGWRLLLQFMLFIVFGGLMLAAKEYLIRDSFILYHTAALCIAGTGSVWISSVLVDKRSFTSLGIENSRVWRNELLYGVLIGGIPMLTLFAVGWSAGWFTVSGFGWERASSMPYFLWIGSYLLAMGLVAFYEELIFRGYQLVNIIEGLFPSPLTLANAAAAALVISSLVFALLHAGNPHAGWLSTVNIVLAGLILALPFLLTGRLALSVGMHFSWNFTQGGLLGLPVSGSRFRGSLLQVEQQGADWITGGNFGPEAGMLGLLGILLMLILFGLYIHKTHQSLSVSLSLEYASVKSSKMDE